MTDLEACPNQYSFKNISKFTESVSNSKLSCIQVNYSMCSSFSNLASLVVLANEAFRVEDSIYPEKNIVKQNRAPNKGKQ